MTHKSDYNLEAGIKQNVLHEVPQQDINTEARVARKFGPGTDSWYKDTIATPQLLIAKEAQIKEEKAKVSLKNTVNDLKNGIVKSAKRLKEYVVNGFSQKEAAILKAQKNGKSETYVEEEAAVNESELPVSFKSDSNAQAVKSPETPEVQKVSEEPIQASSVNEIEEVNAIVQADEIEEVVPTAEEVIDSLADNISKIIAEAEEELKENKDILTGIIVGIAKELNTELRKESLNWSKIDLLVRQLSVLLVQKMANNDHKTIQEELDQLQRDIDKVAQSYKGKWEMALGIISGALSIAGGTVGLAGGFGALGGVASSTLKSLQGVSQALGSVGQGVGQFGSIARNANERDRAVHQYEMERDRGYKSNADESLRNNRSAKTAHINQINSSIEAMFRAWIAVVS